MSVKLVCPECNKASAPKKPRTFDCPACGYHNNYSINYDGSVHYYKAGRRGQGLVLTSKRLYAWQAKLNGETIRAALDKAKEIGYIS